MYGTLANQAKTGESMAKQKNRHSASRKRALKKKLGGNNQRNA